MSTKTIEKCLYCEQVHEVETIDSLSGFPIKTCPNHPKSDDVMFSLINGGGSSPRFIYSEEDFPAETED